MKTKEDVLALIQICESEAEYALTRDDIELTDERREGLEKVLKAIKNEKEKFEKVPEDDQRVIDGYYNIFTNLFTELKKINQPTLNHSTDIQIKGENPIIPQDDENGIIPTNDEKKDIIGLDDENLEEPKDNSKKMKVKKVIPEEEQTEETKEQRDRLTRNLRRIFYVLGSAAALAIIIATIKYYVDHPKDQKANDLPRTTQSDVLPTKDSSNIYYIEDGANDESKAITEELPEEVQKVFKIADVDINDYNQLVTYATEINNELNDTRITIDDIMYAIRMANWDKLQDKSCFTDRQGVCRSTYNAGVVATKLGSDAIVQKDLNSDIFITDQQMADILVCVTNGKLTLADFESAKVEDRGYDIYAVIDRCVAGMNEHVGSTDENDIIHDTHYARVFNEVVTRATISFSIVNSDEALLSTVYTLLGTYNANSNRLMDLTKQDGPIYGTGPRIDGNYGNICALEVNTLVYIDKQDKNGTPNFIGNEKNIFYSGMIDEVILNPEKSMGLN